MALPGRRQRRRPDAQGFTDCYAPAPPGARLPTGTYLDFTVDPATFEVLDLGLSRHAPVIPLRTFGRVTRLV